jgi:hypothetical protein
MVTRSDSLTIKYDILDKMILSTLSDHVLNVNLTDPRAPISIICFRAAPKESSNPSG